MVLDGGGDAIELVLVEGSKRAEVAQSSRVIQWRGANSTRWDEMWRDMPDAQVMFYDQTKKIYDEMIESYLANQV